jgi:hypothetical protein
MNAHSDIEGRSDRLVELEIAQMRLFRVGLLLLAFFATAFSTLAWEQVRQLPISLDAAPIGASVLMGLFVIHGFRQAHSLSQLRALKGSESTEHQQP